ncbi:MAG: PD40 domain-containing protein [Anaerolineae bacterium]|nr:PD40 domain-containing protein [Anaerolineae bacterium]
MSQPTQTETKRRFSRWQIGLLLLMLLAFLAAAYTIFLPPKQTTNPLPPVLYLAEDDAGRLQLYRAAAPDWQPTQLTQETAEILTYAPAPNGSQIAYTIILPDGSSQLKLLPLREGASGESELKLTCANAECAQPVWHPDGRRLLYERREPPNFSRPQLWWLDTQTGETILLRENSSTVSSSARFSPDGRWVSYAGSPDEGLQVFNFENGRSLSFPSNVGTPAAWHPLNNQLLFQNTRAVILHSGAQNDHTLHEHDVAVGVSLYLGLLTGPSDERPQSHLLSEDAEFNDGNAAWSPDGQWIAFGRRPASINSGRQLWLMRADGSEAHALTNDLTQHFGPPSWSPDGRYLLFQQYNATTPDQPPTIQLLEVATGSLTQITPHGLLPTFLTTN